MDVSKFRDEGVHFRNTGEKRVNEYSIYHIYAEYLDRDAWANSVDPDQVPQLSLYCGPLIQ